jgi:hypothetical protein
MPIAEAPTEKPREDFSLETYRHLESRLNEIRRQVMDLAAQAALADTPSADIYSVKRVHVDAALRTVLGDSHMLFKLVGIEK